MNLTALDLARAYLGVHERAGDADHPLILSWLELCAIDDPHDEIPWCSAFVNGVTYLFERYGVPRSKSPAARSWLRVGQAVELEDARPGWDVIVLQRGSGPQPGPEVIAAPGHVGFFVERYEGRVLVLGGNQGDAVTVASFPESRVLGIRRLYSE